MAVELMPCYVTDSGVNFAIQNREEWRDVMSDSSEVDPRGTRVALDQATHAPGAIYASPEIFRREVAEYFKREWLYVGRVEELADPGDYMALRLVG